MVKTGAVHIDGKVSNIKAVANSQVGVRSETQLNEAFRIRQDLQTIDFFTQHIEDVESLISQLSVTEEWAEAVACLAETRAIL